MSNRTYDAPFFVVNDSIKPCEVPTPPATLPSWGVVNALGGFAITTRDHMEVSIMMVVRWSPDSWRRRCCCHARMVFFQIPRFFESILWLQLHKFEAISVAGC